MIISFQCNSYYRFAIKKVASFALYCLSTTSGDCTHSHVYRESPVGLSRLPTCHFCILQMILGTVTCRRFFAGLLPALTFAPRKTCSYEQQPHASTLSMSQQVLIYTTLNIKSTRKILFYCIFLSTIL